MAHGRGGYSDLIVEKRLVQDDDLQTETMVMLFHYSVDQALDSLSGNGRKGESSTRMKKEGYTTCRCALLVDSGANGLEPPKLSAAQPLTAHLIDL